MNKSQHTEDGPPRISSQQHLLERGGDREGTLYSPLRSKKKERRLQECRCLNTSLKWRVDRVASYGEYLASENVIHFIESVLTDGSGEVAGNGIQKRRHKSKPPLCEMHPRHVLSALLLEQCQLNKAKERIQTCIEMKSDYPLLRTQASTYLQLICSQRVLREHSEKAFFRCSELSTTTEDTIAEPSYSAYSKAEND